MNETTPDGRADPGALRLPRLLVLAAWIVFAAEALLCVLCQDTVYDEGGYLYEGWLAVARGWLPFRDFAAKVPPVIYYTYGLPQAALGPGLLVGRLEAALLTAGALALAAPVARRLGGPWGPPLLLWGFVVSFETFEFYFRALAYPVVALWIALALFCLEGPRSPGESEDGGWPYRGLRPWRLYGALLSTTLLALSRHDLLAIYVPLGLYALAQGFSRRHKVAATALSVLLVLAVIGPFAVLSPSRVVFALTAGVPRFLLPRSLAELKVANTMPYVMGMPHSAYSVAWYAMMNARDYFFPLLLLALPLGRWVMLGGPGLRRRLQQLSRPALLLALLVLADILLNLVASVLGGASLSRLKDWYVALPLFLLAAVAMARLLERADRPLRAALLALCVCGGAMAIVIKGPPDIVRLRRPPTALRFARGAEALRRHSSPGARVLSLAETVTVLEARREVFPPLTHALFAFTEARTDQCRPVLRFNREMLDEWLVRDADVVVTSEEGERWLARSGRYARGQELLNLVNARLKRYYRRAEVVPQAGYGRVSIYVRARE